MAPRQRLAPQPSTEELAIAAAAHTKSLLSAVETEANLLSSEIEIARENHDLFNIIALLPVIAATLVNWNLRLLLKGPGEAWNGNYFYLNLATTVSYFLIDLVWVACTPACVKSPDVIIKHHILAIVYLAGPLKWPQYRWFMGACLTVEINTWFLILRRVLYKRKNQISPALRELVSLSFYISWIVIRILLYPAIMVLFCLMAWERVVETGVLWHWEMMFIPVHFFLCVLNLKWSVDLFSPLISKMLSKSGGKDGIGVSNGL